MEVHIEKLLNVQEVAEILQLSPHTIYKYTSKKQIPFIKVNKNLLFRESDIQDWLDNNKVKTI